MTKIYADGADLNTMLNLAADPRIKGFTTNPSLCLKAGVKDYGAFGKALLSTITDKPISFEVLSDDFGEMERQALEISSWGKNAVVKIPIVNTKGKPSYALVDKLLHASIPVNITAMMTGTQVMEMAKVIKDRRAILSIFAGRIADTGKDPVEFMKECFHLLRNNPGIELLWASPREVLNYYQAERIGCHIITMTPELIKKLDLKGKSLAQYSRDTVKMFVEDGKASGLTL
jgi:transaldolase